MSTRRTVGYLRIVPATDMRPLHLTNSATTAAPPDVDSGALSRVLRDRALNVVYQPIATLGTAGVHAHEALIRGPRGMPLHSPDALFAAARREGLLCAFERACLRTALLDWSRRQQPGRLFVNLSAAALIDLVEARDMALPDSLQSLGVAARMLVIEITEHERVTDIRRLQEVVRTVHACGVSIALDDFGDGRSSLRLWSEIKPEVVKIDKYFTKDISRHADKLQTLRALMQIAETFSTALVAEGIETEDDLRVLRDLGLAYGQGFFLGRPDATPRETIDAAAQRVLADARVAVMPQQRRPVGHGAQRELVPIIAPTATPDTTCDELVALFLARSDLHAIALVDDGTPRGILARQQFMDRYSKLYFKELYGRKSCAAFANPAPRLVERHHDIDELIGILTSQDQRYLTEGFVITENGRYVGLGTGEQLVRTVTEARIEAARHANPLTFLPGNIPITQHVERLLRSGAEFTACYADLNGFKPFNDHYGYWRGDEMIRLLARVISWHCDPRRDFVGHVGGDDFLVLFQSGDWEQRCARIVAEFDREARQLFDEEARQAGGIQAEDRDGVKRFFPCTTLAIGAIRVQAGQFDSAEAVASASAQAKRLAKLGRHGLYCAENGAGAAPREAAGAVR